MKKALVTGATGFLGSNLVHQLVAQGWDVRASGMHGSETKYIKDLPVELVLADITKADEVDKIVAGCEIVFNVAGDTSFWQRNYKRQWAINVDGAENVARSCKKQGVSRLIHTSTLDTLGYNPTGGSYDEVTGRFNFDNMGYHYGESKLEGEIRTRAFNSQELEVIVIHPGFMMGPLDYTLQIGRAFFDLKAGDLPGVPPGGASICHVTEVAKAHIQAALKGRPGESYLCAGMPKTNIPFNELFSKMASAVDANPPKFVLPKALFIGYGYLSEFWANFSGKAPQMNPGMARYLSCPQYAVSGKAIAELDYHVPTVDDCIADALNWYRQQGYDI